MPMCGMMQVAGQAVSMSLSHLGFKLTLDALRLCQLAAELLLVSRLQLQLCCQCRCIGLGVVQLSYEPP